jgi:hypothetical protein
MVVAVIALFVSLSGVAVAGTTGLVSGSQIKDHTISFAKLSPVAVARLRGNIEPQGTPGLQGPPGGFDPNKVTYVQGPATHVDPFSVSGVAVTLSASCPAGSKVLGGGGFVSIATIGAIVPAADGSGWGVIVINESTIPLDGLFALRRLRKPVASSQG